MTTATETEFVSSAILIGASVVDVVSLRSRLLLLLSGVAVFVVFEVRDMFVDVFVGGVS